MNRNARFEAHPDDFTFRPVDPDADAALLHGWVTDPKAVFWLMQQATVADVAREYRSLDARIGLFRGEPAVLTERYDIASGELADVHRALAGDVGMHLLTAPTDTPVPGFTRAAMTAVLRELFADPAVRRVVVEPDLRNRAVHALNAAVGFRPVRPVTLPRSGKRALLSTCTREQFHAATGDRDPLAHLTPELWAAANRHLVRKALAEFAHERLISPVPLPEGGGWYGVGGDDDSVAYRFRAELLALDHWRIDPESLTRVRTADGTSLPLDAAELVRELRRSLGLTDTVLPLYLEEVTSTLASAAYKLSLPPVPAAELAAADLQTVEAGMTEGHPCFVANNGRLGFDAAEYPRYAPEVGAPVRLLWVAVHPDHAVVAAGHGVDPADLVDLTLQVPDGLDDHLLIPVHPWQWQNRIAVTYADEIAAGRIVLLGEGRESHLPQQSIRTFFNTTVPGKPYVKTALSVLNMGFVRGLSADYMEHTPAINDWLADLVATDPTLTACDFSILREHAAVGYRHPRYPKGTPQQKMLAALWRESPLALLREGERAVTMAALLHTDRDGASFAAALVADSGLTAKEWLRRYLTAYLVPVVHCLFAYGLTFMPHGENVLLVLDEHGTPLRVFFKDIAEEIAVLDKAVPLPPEVARIRAEVPEEHWALSVQTDVFDCFLRFLSAELHACGALDQHVFWGTVAQVIRGYQAAHPQLAERFARHDLFAARFPLSCLNRLQLRDNRQMVDLTDPSGALQFAGTLANPLVRNR
ncbi:GNAT family N-acetyltransferase [Streptacidiphilus sp. MAP5-3]|uniref:GNAT family N-acetyltransferase n=1 Tax=unclassified Streptacidiphilus TaxID=2643834 RepID=UPI003511563F